METKYDEHSMKDLEDMDLSQCKEYKAAPFSDHPKTIRQHAIERAAKMLALRPYARQELYQKLIGRGFPIPAAIAAIDRMDELGALNDEVYGEGLIRRFLQKGYGPVKIEIELYKVGIDQEIRSMLMERLPDEQEMALQYVTKVCDPEDLEDQVYFNKLANGMKRNGYHWGSINEALRRYQEEGYQQEAKENG